MKSFPGCRVLSVPPDPMLILGPAPAEYYSAFALGF